MKKYKNKIKKDEYSDSELSKQKQKRNGIIRDVVDLLLIGALVVGGTVLPRKRPVGDKVYDNAEKIAEIAPTNNVDTSYVNLFLKIPVLKDYAYRTLYMPVWKDTVDVYINLNITSEQKMAIDYSVQMLNEINQKTYTNIPPIVLHYGENKLDPFAINIKETEFNDTRAGEERCYLQYPSFYGLLQMFPYIKIDREVVDFEIPTVLSSTIMHELLHALYGFGENYYVLSDGYGQSKSTPSIMGAVDGIEYDFLSPNDIYAINCVTWKTTPTDEQLKEIQQFYKEYAEKYEKCQTPVAQYLKEQAAQNQKEM